MQFFHTLTQRRTNSFSSQHSVSSTSSLSEEVMGMTLPMAPREDDYNMSEKLQSVRLLAKCKRAAKEPWKSAKPLPVKE